MNPKDHPCNSPYLVWKEEDVKHLFSTRQWPTFIGVPPPVMQTKSRNLLTAEQTLKQQMNETQKQSMPLPVLVWKEQTLRSNAQQMHDDGSDSHPQNKRKRTSDDETSSENFAPSASSSAITNAPTIENSKAQYQPQQSKRARIEENSWSMSMLPQSIGQFCWRQINRMFSIFSSTESGHMSNGQVTQHENTTSHVESEDMGMSTISTDPEAVVTVADSNTENTTSKRKVIFEDLRNRGYFVGPGDVYGGDYCIYKGKDPSQSHSVATIRVSDGKIAAKDLLCFSRVQNQVAKSAVLAFPRPLTTDGPTLVDSTSTNSDSDAVGYVVFNFRAVSVRN